MFQVLSFMWSNLHVTHQKLLPQLREVRHANNSNMSAGIKSKGANRNCDSKIGTLPYLILDSLHNFSFPARHHLDTNMSDNGKLLPVVGERNGEQTNRRDDHQSTKELQRGHLSK